MRKKFFATILFLMAILGIGAQTATLVPKLIKSGDTGIAAINSHDTNIVHIDTKATLTIAVEPQISEGSITIAKDTLSFDTLIYKDISLTSDSRLSYYFKNPGTVKISGKYRNENGEELPFVNTLIVNVYNPVSYTISPDEPQELFVGYNTQEDVTFSIDAHGGNDAGWSLQWQHEDKDIEGGNGSSYTISGKDVSLDQSGNYSVRVENKAEDGTSLFATQIKGYLLTVYDRLSACKVQGDSRIIVNNGKIRHGESLYISCDISDAEWKYRWRIDDNPIDNDSLPYLNYTDSTPFSGEGMDTRRLTFYLETTNDSISKFYGVPLIVYNHPRTPIKLTRKGNGSSHTFIIMLPNGLTDDVLAQNRYQFVFGYTDAYGIDHDLTTTSSRYFRMDNARDYNNTSTKYYAYSLWNYPDGALVTSNKCILDADEEYFDGSDFDMVTRSDVTSITHALSEQVNIHGNHISAYFDKPVRVSVTICSVHGDVVAKHVLGIKKNYNEQIAVNGLTPGIYLLIYNYDTRVEVEKVIVK
jgi:hypothetical protein